MLLLLIIILVLIWAAVVWSIYSNFLVFYSNFSETENYHKAYYAAISALERGELVVKQRSPWFKWFAWRYRNQNTNTKQWTWFNWSDWVITSDFSYLSDNNKPSEIIRSVDSLAENWRIPEIEKWNVEFLLRSTDSENYNMMWYEDAEVFLMYYDSSSDDPYTRNKCTDNWSCGKSSPNEITWKIRLPQKLLLSGDFTLLDTNSILVWTNNQLPKDDAIVDRQIRWKYTDTSKPIPTVTYTMYSTQKTKNNNKDVDYHSDTIFRESDINNNSWSFMFSNSWNPIQYTNINYHGKDWKATIISQFEETINNLKSFTALLGPGSKSSENQLRFSLLNLVKDHNLKIYPFLEYYIDFWTEVADRNYTINGKWSFWDFQVNIPRQKPTVKETVLWNFTSIF